MSPPTGAVPVKAIHKGSRTRPLLLSSTTVWRIVLQDAMTTILVKPTTKSAAIDIYRIVENEKTTKPALIAYSAIFTTLPSPLMLLLAARYSVAVKAPAPAEDTRKPKVCESPCRTSEANTGRRTGNVRPKKLINAMSISSSFTGEDPAA
jgi:hypothetical protein